MPHVIINDGMFGTVTPPAGVFAYTVKLTGRGGAAGTGGSSGGVSYGGGGGGGAESQAVTVACMPGVPIAYSCLQDASIGLLYVYGGGAGGNAGSSYVGSGGVAGSGGTGTPGDPGEIGYTYSGGDGGNSLHPGGVGGNGNAVGPGDNGTGYGAGGAGGYGRTPIGFGEYIGNPGGLGSPSRIELTWVGLDTSSSSSTSSTCPDFCRTLVVTDETGDGATDIYDWVATDTWLGRDTGRTITKVTDRDGYRWVISCPPEP